MADGTNGVAEAPQTRAPVDDLFRAITLGGISLREEPDPDEGRTLFGHFAVFNRWTEIDSWFEGHFMERIAPGAFKKSFRDTQPKVLFQHGHDMELRDRVIASVRELKEDESGAYYEARLLDGLPELVLAGLREGEYGASFRFGVMREEWIEEPGTSEENPKGLPERTLKELRVSEFGPVTFPAYGDATAGVRSLTDELRPGVAQEFLHAIKGGSTPDLTDLVDLLRRRDQRATQASAPPTSRADTERVTRPAGAAQDPTSASGEQDTAPPNDHAETPDSASHLGRGRRGRTPTLYTGRPGRKETRPSWHL